MVPQQANVLMAARADRPVPAAESRATVAQSGQLAQPAATSNRVKTVYKVQEGDTLFSIARLFNTTVTSLKTWNPSVPANRLMAGERLTVYRVTN